MFIQGLLSFFSPCVLPLIPLYVGYLAGGTAKRGEDGTFEYPRVNVLMNTVFFVVGVSFAFFLLGFGFTALGQFFTGNQRLFSILAGLVMAAFGLYMLGAFGKARAIETQRRLPFRLDRFAMNPLVALVLGFTFSFCVDAVRGPVLASVLLMASSSASAATGFLLVGVYTLGFVLPFLAVGLFTGEVLRFFKSHGNVVKYTVKVGGALLIVMGIMTITGWMNGVTSYLSSFGAAPAAQEQPATRVRQTVTRKPVPVRRTPMRVRWASGFRCAAGSSRRSCARGSKRRGAYLVGLQGQNDLPELLGHLVWAMPTRTA